MSDLPEDIVQLGLDVKAAQESQARLEVLKRERQRALEAMSGDITTWITKLVGELRQLVASDPRSLNPHNRPLDHVVQVLDPVYGVGLVYNGLRIIYKLVDGAISVSGGNRYRGLLTDVNEQTVRVEALKAIRLALDTGSPTALAPLSDA